MSDPPAGAVTVQGGSRGAREPPHSARGRSGTSSWTWRHGLRSWRLERPASRACSPPGGAHRRARGQAAKNSQNSSLPPSGDNQAQREARRKPAKRGRASATGVSSPALRAPTSSASPSPTASSTTRRRRVGDAVGPERRRGHRRRVPPGLRPPGSPGRSHRSPGAEAALRLRVRNHRRLPARCDRPHLLGAEGAGGGGLPARA